MYKIKRPLNIRYYRLIVIILGKSKLYNSNCLGSLILLKTLHKLTLNNNFVEKNNSDLNDTRICYQKIKFFVSILIYVSLNFLFIVCFALKPLTSFKSSDENEKHYGEMF